MAHRFPRRFVVFTMVGISGIFVNTFFLWMGTEWLGLPYQIASLAAIQIAIINNYTWNLRFTWRDREIKGMRRIMRKFGQFTLVSWVAGGVNWIALILLTELGKMYYLIANLIAILIASLVNYFANDLWTFHSGQRQGSDEAGQSEGGSDTAS